MMLRNHECSTKHVHIVHVQRACWALGTVIVTA